MICERPDSALRSGWAEGSKNPSLRKSHGRDKDKDNSGFSKSSIQIQIFSQAGHYTFTPFVNTFTLIIDRKWYSEHASKFS